MYRKFVNARSPMRLLEKGLHGGLGIGNVGVVLAGHGMGKTGLVVSMALDELLRGGSVLHVALDQTVAHVRSFYDTVFEELAQSTHLDDAAAIHAEIDRRRSIRAYAPSVFTAGKLRDAIALENEAGLKPSVILIEGVDFGELPAPQIEEIRQVAKELAAEVWFSVGLDGERTDGIPESVSRFGDTVSVVLALEPAQGNDTLDLRALKDHDNPDLSDLHVALDPRTLLLVRS